MQYDQTASTMTNGAPEDAYISAALAGQLLGVSRQRLAQLRMKGQVTAHRVGRAWFYARASIDARRAQKTARGPGTRPRKKKA